MAAQKTLANETSVDEFLNTVEDPQKRNDCMTLIQLIGRITGYEPKMWGSSIVGFGTYHYRYASGHEGDSPIVGFSPRKKSITMYLMCGLPANKALLENLGKHKTGVGCLYIDSIDAINLDILEQIIRDSIVMPHQTDAE